MTEAACLYAKTLYDGKPFVFDAIYVKKVPRRSMSNWYMYFRSISLPTLKLRRFIKIYVLLLIGQNRAKHPSISPLENGNGSAAVVISLPSTMLEQPGALLPYKTETSTHNDALLWRSQGDVSWALSSRSDTSQVSKNTLLCPTGMLKSIFLWISL